MTPHYALNKYKFGSVTFKSAHGVTSKYFSILLFHIDKHNPTKISVQHTPYTFLPPKLPIMSPPLGMAATPFHPIWATHSPPSPLSPISNHLFLEDPSDFSVFNPQRTPPFSYSSCHILTENVAICTSVFSLYISMSQMS